MKHSDFRKFLRTGELHRSCDIVPQADEDAPTFISGQSCSIGELLDRQSRGLPMPVLTPTHHLSFNGLDARDIDKPFTDVIDAQNQLHKLQADVQKDVDYATDVYRLTPKKLKKDE